MPSYTSTGYLSTFSKTRTQLSFTYSLPSSLLPFARLSTLFSLFFAAPKSTSLCSLLILFNKHLTYLGHHFHSLLLFPLIPYHFSPTFSHSPMHYQRYYPLDSLTRLSNGCGRCSSIFPDIQCHSIG